MVDILQCSLADVLVGRESTTTHASLNTRTQARIHNTKPHTRTHEHTHTHTYTHAHIHIHQYSSWFPVISRWRGESISHGRRASLGDVLRRETRKEEILVRYVFAFHLHVVRRCHLGHLFPVPFFRHQHGSHFQTHHQR